MELSEFGSMVFGEKAMRERLPKETYRALRRTIERGRPLEPALASVVANAMKDWAVERGATHYTHWFQPMTGYTAEKHDSFLSPSGDGQVISELTGKELSMGEPDASSFPSGGLRATFEARGYTAWDPTSYAFIKGNTLCIPTAFCSWGGAALDKKTPLLRSMEALNRETLRILRLFGNTQVRRVLPTVGAEQEYFLVDRAMAAKRLDLRICGRTLFGARPVKGQELDDHYFGALRPRVAAFMAELDEELWKLGVLAKTEHNEAAPCQHELAPLYTTTNLAADQNQLTMELMRIVAERHGLLCLLHEKPFEGVNGSGKHNNWSLQTDLGQNLFEPGENPSDNAQFLLFLVAALKAFDEHQDLLRLSVASAGNDHRLGAAEAPPAIVSMFLGEELTGLLDSIESGGEFVSHGRTKLRLGVDAIGPLPADVTDRNRTSPMAFTGNKFEFRMVGSNMSISCPNVMMNVSFADALCQFADELEPAEDFHAALEQLLRREIRAHRRILFNGNNYTQDWVAEAERRGLLNLLSTPEALAEYTNDKNLVLFTKYGIYTEPELRARREILLENYCKTIRIEASAMLEMAERDIWPAVVRYTGELSDAVYRKRRVLPDAPQSADEKRLRALSGGSERLSAATEALHAALDGLHTSGMTLRAAEYRDCVLPAMRELRAAADAVEPLVDRRDWPMPTYTEMLFYE